MIRSFFKRKTRLSRFAPFFSAEELLQLFDVFYVCFDEPNRSENWQQIQSVLPKARKVEGVEGFDNALKTCARLASTDYFFVIDGDNQLISSRLGREIKASDIEDEFVLSWSSYNAVNGLAYGNGGLKLWPKEIALSIKSHETAEDGDDQTDYCFIADYYLIDDFVTQTIMNSTFSQAFRAGFREGVKMSLAWGRQVPLNLENFEKTLGRQNRERLKIWCEIGEDSLHGCWAIAGARLGLCKNVVDMFDYKNINSYAWIEQCLHREVLSPLGLSQKNIENLEWDKDALQKYSSDVASRINQRIPINIRNFSPLESLQFKRSFKNPARSGLLGRQPRP